MIKRAKGRPATHGRSRISDPVYSSWYNMKQRCGNPNDPYYADYGGRGISVCPRWDRFENFLADMGERPAGTSLDRYPDPNGNYEPGNCRWATQVQQRRNTRQNVNLTLRGVTQCVAAWAEVSGVPRYCIYERLTRGWPPERAVFEPPRRKPLHSTQEVGQ